MILIFDQCIEEWGDCKGRAWCGTCHIEIISDSLVSDMNLDETHTLNRLANRTTSSRLACQIPTDEHLAGLEFKILGDG
ncbi:MAG: 2Fe-2S iron-sulfur cluster-binding protein [Reichenbachiella sp.]